MKRKQLLTPFFLLAIGLALVACGTQEAPAATESTSSSAGGQLPESYTIADFGYRLSLPAGWQGTTEEPVTVLSQLEEDHRQAFVDSYSPMGLQIALDHRDQAFMSRLGLPDEPSLDDLLELNRSFFNMPESAVVDETTIFGEPAFVVRTSNGDGWGLNYMGFKEGESFLFVLSAPTEVELEAYLPTWDQILTSLEPVGDA